MLPSTAVGTVEPRSLLEPIRISNEFVSYLEADCDYIDMKNKVGGWRRSLWWEKVRGYCQAGVTLFSKHLQHANLATVVSPPSSFTSSPSGGLLHLCLPIQGWLQAHLRCAVRW
jgi:hypothetical protein